MATPGQTLLAMEERFNCTVGVGVQGVQVFAKKKNWQRSNSSKVLSVSFCLLFKTRQEINQSLGSSCFQLLV